MTEIPAADFPTPAAAPRTVRSRSLSGLALLRLSRNRAAVGGFFMLIAITLFCVAGPWLSPYHYDQQFRSYVGVPPSLEPHPAADVLAAAMRRVASQARVTLEAFAVDGSNFRAEFTAPQGAVDPRITRFIDRADEFKQAAVLGTAEEGRRLIVTGEVIRLRFLFGTDTVGRDLMTRIMIGGRVSLLVGILATLVSLFIGVTYGAIAGYFGGRVDNLMMRVVDILYSLPFIFFVILLVVFFGRNFVLIFVAIGAIEWLDMARIVRGQTLALKQREFVEAAHALGVGPGASCGVTSCRTRSGRSRSSPR